MRYLIIVLAGILILQGSLIPQLKHSGLQSANFLAQATGGDEVFLAVQRGLSGGNIDELTRHFGKHIYLNIRSVESGHYSANQAQFVVQNFFNANKPISFSFTTYGESGGAPYATGRGSINVKGNREYIQVYVSLSKHRDRWIISQFNVY